MERGPALTAEYQSTKATLEQLQATHRSAFKLDEAATHGENLKHQ